MLSQRTINYAIPPDDHYWIWSDGYDAIEWADGRTLALWPEIHTVLAYLGAEKGIPPLGSVLLILAACRSDWELQRAFNHSNIRAVMGMAQNVALTAEIAEVLITGLDRVHLLPEDLRTSLSAKCLLVSALFEGGPHCLLRRDTELVLKDLSIFGLRYATDHKPEMTAKARFLRDMRALKTGLARHSAASLESLLRTGIENSNLREPELPQQPLEPGDPRDLIDRLIDAGGEGKAAAAVAKRTIAMINFPGRFGTPRDLPVGGISDITNRGTIDRLLPGELAWDDLVLAARLVHNEALYFRREIPPMDVAVSHTVLLDRGIRLWGAGRVLSLGVALGLRHHPALQEPGEIFEVVASTGDAFEYLDLTTPSGVLSSLETLVPSPSPEKFLTTWWDAAQITDDPSIPDVTFITAREHLEEDATRRLLGEVAGWIHARSGHFRVIALSRGGGMEMQAWSPAGNRIICRGELDLSEILRAPVTALSTAPQRTQPNPLHAILPVYAADRMPFLFPVVPQNSSFIADTSGDGVIGVTHDRRLMHWPKLGWGGEELHPHLEGRQHWIGRDDHDKIIVIASGEGAGGDVRVFRWDHNCLEEIKVVSSRHPFPRYATVSGNAVILAYTESVEALSLENGLRVAEIQIQSLPYPPLLHFDGTMICVEAAEPSTLSIHENWSYANTTWPQLFIPQQVSLEKRVLRVKIEKECLSFDPVKLIWSKSKAGVTRFMSFEESQLSPAPGVVLRRAQWGAEMEIWLDPRGLIHLRETNNVDSPPWSILLSSPAASVWRPEHMLCSHEARLRSPTCEFPSREAMKLLNSFLNSP
jgi:hypothetical protein